MGERSDAELVAAFRERGDDRCFEALYRRHRRRVFGLCLHYLGNPAAAEEAVHEGFVKSYEQFGSLRGDNFGAWLNRIATNLCLNRLRARRPQEPVDESLADPAAPRPDEQADASQNRKRAFEVLAALNRSQRRALELKYLEGHSYEEISRIMEESYDRVRSHLQNGRRNFRRLWAGMTQQEGISDESG